MYLPAEIPNAQVLITVKTYPLPSNKYDELVCTAGFFQGKWIRLYPIPFRSLPYKEQYNKYHWVTLDLIRNIDDFRPESYRPKRGADEKIVLGEKIGTEGHWAKRKEFALAEVFTSMNDLIALAKDRTKNKSLATLKPREIIDVIIEEDEREWKPDWQAQLRQYNLFDLDQEGQGKERKVLPKVPYKFFYKFISDGDRNPRKLLIEDWELGALYRNCLKSSGGNEEEAKLKVKEKFFDDLALTKDLYLFLGTTKQYHHIAPNPFIVVGVFYPTKPQIKPRKQKMSRMISTEDLIQQNLFDGME